MTTADLIAEGEAIMRPAFVLREQSNVQGAEAYWGGVLAAPDGQAEPSGFSRRHVCTVSELLLTRLDVYYPRPLGPLRLYEVELHDGERSHRAERDPRLRFDALSFTDALPLSATLTPLFPPFAALCLHGSERIGRWLSERGFARHDYWRADTPASAEYEEEWMRRSPFYDPTVVAVVGGWHFLWPEDDFYVPPECRLLLLTQRNAEPWVEVWHGLAGGVFARERIT